jgi:hypothetical protein
MMIIDVNFQAGVGNNFGKLPDPADLASVDQNQPFYVPQVNIFYPFHFKGVECGMDKEVSKVSLLGPGKNQHGVRIEFLGRQHGRQRIKIRIRVGGDDFHKLKSKKNGVLE